MTAQIAVALIVLVGAGLLVRSFDRLVSTPAGFKTDNLLTARITLPSASYGDDKKIQAFYEQLIARVRTLPGVSPSPATSSRRSPGPVPEPISRSWVGLHPPGRDRRFRPPRWCFDTRTDHPQATWR